MNDGDAPDAGVLVCDQVQDCLVQVLVKILSVLLIRIEDGVQYVDGAYNGGDVSGDNDNDNDEDEDDDDDGDNDVDQPGQKGST